MVVFVYQCLSFVYFCCVNVNCVFIGSSASHISLERWNNLSGTVFPQGFILKIFIFFCFILIVCVRLGKLSDLGVYSLQRVFILKLKWYKTTMNHIY